MLSHFRLGDSFMRKLSVEATRNARAYIINSVNHTTTAWNEINNFLQNDIYYPFNRQDLRHYNVTNRRFR